ncbi:MAG: hypothetical protein KJO46_06880 [Gammaproteobacteria bacterium]|nr:hypothetical protein [Gammaproteobacteria bacterium]
MKSNNMKTLVSSKTTMRKSWLALYAALISAIVFADPATGVAASPAAAVSPVVIDTEAPGFDVRSFIRRLDI